MLGLTAILCMHKCIQICVMGVGMGMRIVQGLIPIHTYLGVRVWISEKDMMASPMACITSASARHLSANTWKRRREGGKEREMEGGEKKGSEYACTL